MSPAERRNPNGTWRTIALVAAAMVGLAVVAMQSYDRARAEPAQALPAAMVDNPKAPGGLQTAVLAGGCFWGTQGVFEHVKGVRQVVAGYAGGDKTTAMYEIVGTGTTGHAESIQITFDPGEISYGEILRIFFSVAHDPTQLNRQGPDRGTQYRSAIFYGDVAQQKIATAYIDQLGKSGAFMQPIVTRVDPLKGFYPAESYHQDFLIHHPDYPYIVYNDQPKIRNLKRLFPDAYREAPVTVQAKAPA